MTERPEIWAVADSLQMDLRAATAKLTQLRAMLAGLELPNPAAVKCPHCGLKARGPNTLAEHLYVSHNGPLPPHWEQADSLVAQPPRDPDELVRARAIPDPLKEGSA